MNEHPDIQVILTRYDEDVSWARDLNPIVYDKGPSPLPGSVQLPNIGFDAHTPLHHFAENYDHLKTITVCLQADPFGHLNENVEQLYAMVRSFDADSLSFTPFAREGFWITADGQSRGWSISERGASPERIRELWEGIVGYPPHGLFHFWQGCQFAVHRDHVRRRPKEFYRNAADMIKTKADGIVVETMFGHIFS